MLRDIARTLRRRAAPAAPGSVGELVFSGPLPPARTGVATYDRAVLDGLRRIGFFDRHRMDVLWPIEPKDAPRLPGYRLGVFQLGNNVEFHLEAYRAAFLAQASLIVLHDLALDDFVRALRTLGDPLGFMATREAAALRIEPHARRTWFATNRSASRGARTSLGARAASSCTRSSAGDTSRSSAAARRSSSCRTRSWSRMRDMRRAADRGTRTARAELETSGCARSSWRPAI